MKKFIVNLEVNVVTLVSYEVESESEEQLHKDLDMWSVEDLGVSVKEEQLYYNEKIDSVHEMKGE